MCLILQDEFEDPHKPSPSPVVHVRGLSDGVSEGDLVESIQNFGPIRFGFLFKIDPLINYLL